MIRRRINCNFCELARPQTWLASGLLLLAACLSTSVMADGCFVFRWDKKADINEPAQKAILFHDAGREELLLQVKYKGPLDQFGWLIPVPALPTVKQGSMQAFYELSRLTQWRQGWENFGGAPSRTARDSADEAVKVIEVKTVGAYEVAILSAQDAGSLSRWLRAHAYAIPEGKEGITKEYIRRGWYFIAVKIQLGRGARSENMLGATAKAVDTPARASTTIQRKLASGELHPLLIGFDTPKCIYPLSISAIGAKPSEVSLYVLSAEPLLNKFIFDKCFAKLHQRRTEWDRNAKERERMRKITMQNLRNLQLSWQMYSPVLPGEKGPRPDRHQLLEDFKAMSDESSPATPSHPIEDDFYAPFVELLQCFPVKTEQIRHCVRAMPRLKAGNWYLTKQVWTFQPEEMHDLEFQLAAPVLRELLPKPEGKIAATILTFFGSNSIPTLLNACRSTVVRERLNASAVLPSVPDPRLAEPLLNLLKDEVPGIRYQAIIATAANWDPRFVEPLIGLFRDPDPRIRRQAVDCLRFHESKDRASAYLTLLKDPDPKVQACALEVLVLMNPAGIPRAELWRLIGSPIYQTVSMAASLLQHQPLLDVPRQPATPQSSSTKLDAVGSNNQITFAEAALLTTNRFTAIRLMGLRILRSNADAAAVALALPLLRDTNSIVRRHAFTFLREVSGQDFPPDNPAKWEQWWAINKGTFTGPKTVR